FAVSDPQLEQARADAWEISPTGPLPGAKKMLWATEAAGAIEQNALAGDRELLESSALPAGLRPLGERRALRVPLGEASAELAADGLQLTFTLPAGSYATCVVEEVMKSAAS
ncbi:MAG: tRNA pseudouridine(13) synthase TruD, partial [Deltaproteobacteria bacterium]|nr:tRNA pseudouridine(13) synthase TruD [Deltaproteobacteria bacterium]